MFGFVRISRAQCGKEQDWAYAFSPDGRWKGNVMNGWKKPASLRIWSGPGCYGMNELAFSKEHQLISLAFTAKGIISPH